MQGRHDTQIAKAAQLLAARRWRGTSQAERKQHGKLMAEARWQQDAGEGKAVGKRNEKEPSYV